MQLKTIQGWKLFMGGNYSQKYDTLFSKNVPKFWCSIPNGCWNQITEHFTAVFMDLWWWLFTTKLSYAQLLNWGHSRQYTLFVSLLGGLSKVISFFQFYTSEVNIGNMYINQYGLHCQAKGRECSPYCTSSPNPRNKKHWKYFL